MPPGATPPSSQGRLLHFLSVGPNTSTFYRRWMRRTLLIVGLILLVIFGAVTWISYAAGTNDCATYAFNGTEVNPGGCSADGGGLVVGIIVVIVALILVILGAVLKSKVPGVAAPTWGAQPPGAALTAPGALLGGTHVAPSGKVCLRCGAYYPEPVPAFCSKCGGPVGASPPPAAPRG